MSTLIKIALSFVYLLLFSTLVSSKISNRDLFADDAKKKICDEKHQGWIHALIQDVRCMENIVKLTSPDDLSLLQSCYNTSAQLLYPSTDDELVNLYCEFANNFYSVNNLVNDCFIRNYVQKEVKRRVKQESEKQDINERMDEKEIMKEVIGSSWKLDNDGFEPSKIVSNFMKCLEFDSTDTKGSYGEYFGSFYEDYGIHTDDGILKVKESNKSYCQNSEELEKIISSLKCFEERFPNNKTLFKSCWNDIVFTRSYPKTDEEWKQYLCDKKIDFPLGLAITVDNCVNEEIRDDENKWKESRCSAENLTKVFKEFADDWKYSLYLSDKSVSDIKLYNSICLGKNMDNLTDHLKGNGFWCPGKSPNPVIMNYCWRLQVSRGEFPESRMLRSAPKTNIEWMRFFCTHDYFVRRRQLTDMQEGKECLENMIYLDSRIVFEDESGNKTVRIPAPGPAESVLIKCLDYHEEEEVPLI